MTDPADSVDDAEDVQTSALFVPLVVVSALLGVACLALVALGFAFWKRREPQPQFLRHHQEPIATATAIGHHSDYGIIGSVSGSSVDRPGSAFGYSSMPASASAEMVSARDAGAHYVDFTTSSVQ